MRTTRVNNITSEQFTDLCSHIYAHGIFTGWSGIDWEELNFLDEIREPGNEPEPLSVYMADGWPVAVFQFDTGYTVIAGALAAVRASHGDMGEGKPRA